MGGAVGLPVLGPGLTSLTLIACRAHARLEVGTVVPAIQWRPEALRVCSPRLGCWLLKFLFPCCLCPILSHNPPRVACPQDAPCLATFVDRVIKSTVGTSQPAVLTALGTALLKRRPSPCQQRMEGIPVVCGGVMFLS